MFQDGEKLPDTFDEWLEIAQRVNDTLVAKGICVGTAQVDPATFRVGARLEGMQWTHLPAWLTRRSSPRNNG
jgi:hypothetical protein